MKFEVDVSGEDIFNNDYTIVIAGNNIRKGFIFVLNYLPILL
jgi:hypothetical protein